MTPQSENPKSPACIDCGKKLPKDYPFTFCDNCWENHYPDPKSSEWLSSYLENYHVHRIGSHSDDYGGDSDRPCFCDLEAAILTHLKSEIEKERQRCLKAIKAAKGSVGVDRPKAPLYTQNDLEERLKSEQRELLGRLKKQAGWYPEVSPKEDTLIPLSAIQAELNKLEGEK